MDRNPLTEAELKDALIFLPGWDGDINGIRKKVEFKDFPSAVRFMDACVEGIDQRDHHPVWCNKYKTLDINLSTFDAGHRVTGKDIDLAEFIESKLKEVGLDLG